MDLLTINETAKILKVSPLTVRRYIAREILHASHLGRSVRIRREELDRLLDNQSGVFADLDKDSDWESTSEDDPLWNIIEMSAPTEVADSSASLREEQPTTPKKSAPIENGTIREWRPTSKDDPIWRIADLIDDDGPTDASANIHRYIADAIEDWHR